MIIGTMFAQQYRSTVMMSLYIVGIIMAILMSRLFSKTFFKGEDTPFVMELPPYRFPTAKAIGRHTWQKGKEYLKKMGVETFGKAGEPFDPNLHNAVMHIEDESLGKNVVAQVFQSGYRRGDRILRHAMVQQAN